MLVRRRIIAPQQTGIGVASWSSDATWRAPLSGLERPIIRLRRLRAVQNSNRPYPVTGAAKLSLLRRIRKAGARGGSEFAVSACAGAYTQLSNTTRVLSSLAVAPGIDV